MKATINEMASIIADVIFEEKETILEAYKSEDKKALEDEIYYYLANIAEEGEINERDSI